MRIVFETLAQSNFDNLVSQLFLDVELKEAERVDFRESIFAIQAELRSRLSEVWTQSRDFEVAFDFHYCVCLSGAIYSDRIFCRDYVSIVAKVLSSFRDSRDWAFHTLHEDITDPDLDRGEFVITAERCFLTEAMNTRWRTQLLGEQPSIS
jgi:hypothetical protein